MLLVVWGILWFLPSHETEVAMATATTLVPDEACDGEACYIEAVNEVVPCWESMGSCANLQECLNSAEGVNVECEDCCDDNCDPMGGEGVTCENWCGFWLVDDEEACCEVYDPDCKDPACQNFGYCDP